MSGKNGATIPQDPSAETFAESKGKGKGKGKAAEEDIPQNHVADEDDDDEDDDDEEEEEEHAEGEEDGMEEIDLNNIVEGGRRTRGAKIDFAKAAEQHPAEDDEDEDDEDFQPPNEDTEMSG